MNRPRSRTHRGLPPNLYLKHGSYYLWRDPRNGKTHGLGNDRGSAINQAIEANHHIAGQEAATLVDRLTGVAERTVGDWCDEWEKEHPKARTKLLKEALGHIVLAKLEPLQIAQWLKRWDQKLRMRQAMLSTAKVVFGGAIGAGWIKTNPATDLTTTTPQTTRERLTLDAYKKILSCADPVLAKAMNLALVTGQRRGDIMKLQWSQVSDGHLHVIQSKAKDAERASKIRIPLGLHIAALNLTVGSAIAACKDNVLSKYMLHHVRHQGMAKPGNKFRDKTIEQLFREARDAAGISAENGPTFHEIRSLAARLYKAQGIDVRVLLGHKTDEMVALYQDNRGAEWLTVQL